jgi:hypothetical protein
VTKSKTRALDWDPELGERTWFTHRLTGERGYLIRRDGEDRIRLDRPNDPYAIRKKEADWVQDESWRPITVNQRAQIAFEADRALCRALGLHAEAKRNWNELRDDDRIRWTGTPPKDETRARLYAAVMEALEDAAR